MAVNPLQMILAEPVSAFQRGREAGAMARQRERMEAEQNRALEQRNRLQELYSGITPESDPEAIARQAGMIGGMEGEQQFRQYFGQRDQAKQVQVQARNEGVARIIAEIDRLPPQQQDMAYQQFAAKLPQEWQGLPYAQARGRAIALITPADKLFAQPEGQGPKVVGAGGALVGPDGRVIFQAPNRPQAPVRGQVVTDPTTGAVYTVDPVTGQARPVTMGGAGPSPGGIESNPVVDAVSQLFPGVQVTSGTRTPERNKEVGGVDNSYHVRGQAADVVPQSPQQAQQIRQWAAQNGMEVFDYKDGHLHIEPAPGATNRPLPPISQWGAGDERGPAQSGDNQLRLTPRPKSGPGVKDEATLRREFMAQTKEPFTVINAYNKVQGAASDPSAAGDLSMIFAFMKMLDPNSVVRETEFANAQNAAGVPDRIRNEYNRVMSGERLNPNQRQDFLRQAGNLAKGAQQQVTRFSERYRNLTEGYGLNPENVVFSPFDEVGAPETPVPAQRYRYNPATGELE